MERVLEGSLNSKGQIFVVSGMKEMAYGMPFMFVCYDLCTSCAIQRQMEDSWIFMVKFAVPIHENL